MATNTQMASFHLAERYKIILEEAVKNYPTKSADLSRSYLMWMCQEIMDNYTEWPDHKSNRWIGYIQGVLTALQIVSIDEHRDITRIIVGLYGI